MGLVLEENSVSLKKALCSEPLKASVTFAEVGGRDGLSDWPRAPGMLVRGEGG